MSHTEHPAAHQDRCPEVAPPAVVLVIRATVVVGLIALLALLLT